MNELLQLMHDTVSKIATIKGAAGVLIRGHATLTKEEELKILSAIEQKADELQLVLDNYYKQNKDGKNL